MSLNRICWTQLVFLLSATFFCIVADGDAQEVFPPAEFIGSGNCVQCHANPPRNTITGSTQDFVTVLESQAFFKAADQDDTGKRLFPRTDAHIRAYQSLVGELGAKITNRLGWTSAKLTESSTNKYDLGSSEHHAALLAKARLCLTCHANWRPQSPQPPKGFVQQGIGCEACHGGAKNWEQAHDEVEFRLQSPSDKAKLGMIDVRHPQARVRQCSSCHIGNIAEDKFVTHDMYAAGHPILPAFEIEMFATIQPRHWRYLPEKGHFAHRKEFMEANRIVSRSGDDGTSTDDLPRTKRMMVGGVVTAMESIRLTAGLMRKKLDGDPIEFAIYDCQECHHDLRSNSWRQLRYQDRSPGRLYPPQWPAVLMSNRGKLPPSVAAFYKSFDEQLFGDPDQVIKSSDAALIELEKLAGQIQAMNVNENTAKQVRDRYLETARSTSLDYQSASQLANALFVLELELTLAKLGVAAKETDKRGYPEFPGREPKKLTDLETRFEAGKQDFEIYLKWKSAVLEPTEKQVYESMKGRLETLGWPGFGLPRSKDQWNAISTFDPRTFSRQVSQ